MSRKHLLSLYYAVVIACTFGTLAARAAAATVAIAPKPEAMLTISAAASLKNAVTEVGALFAKHHPHCKLHYNFSNSVQLASQIEHGAPVDVFASADIADVRQLGDKQLIAEQSILARNTLTVIASKSSGKVRALPDLAAQGVRLVFTAPRVPIARYTRQFLARADKAGAYGPDYAQRVTANVVSEEPDVRMVATKIALGEGDAGIVYISDVTPDLRDKVTVIPIPKDYNVVAEYGIGMVREARHPAAAREFYKLMRSAEGSRILVKHGLLPAHATVKP